MQEPYQTTVHDIIAHDDDYKVMHLIHRTRGLYRYRWARTLRYAIRHSRVFEFISNLYYTIPSSIIGRVGVIHIAVLFLLGFPLAMVLGIAFNGGFLPFWIVLAMLLMPLVFLYDTTHDDHIVMVRASRRDHDAIRPRIMITSVNSTDKGYRNLPYQRWMGVNGYYRAIISSDYPLDGLTDDDMTAIISWWRGLTTRVLRRQVSSDASIINIKSIPDISMVDYEHVSIAACQSRIVDCRMILYQLGLDETVLAPITEDLRRIKRHSSSDGPISASKLDGLAVIVDLHQRLDHLYDTLVSLNEDANSVIQASDTIDQFQRRLDTIRGAVIASKA